MRPWRPDSMVDIYNMSELQISLIAIGIVVIMAVLFLIIGAKLTGDAVSGFTS